MLMTGHKPRKTKGQAMVEFALTLPILLFVVMGIFDFSRVMFTYAQANFAMREALRFAQVLGFSASEPFKDCDGAIKTAAEKFWFTTNTIVTIQYEQTSTGSTGTVMSCAQSKLATPPFVLKDGDVLQIIITADVPLVILPDFKVNMDFKGQRTIVSKISLGSSSNDADYDSLDDLWEYGYWGNLNQLATGDSDLDGCNNGCEEFRKSDPTVPDVNPADHADDWPAATTGGTPLTTPYMPTYSVTGLKAKPNCSGGVLFEWTVSNAPSSDSTIEIYDTSTNPHTVVASGIAYNQVSYTLASGGPSGSGTKTYYLRIRTNYLQDRDISLGYEFLVAVRGGASNSASASCDPPKPPDSFKATVNCSASPKTVSFTWNAPTPLPTYVRIYNSNGTLQQDTLYSLNPFGNTWGTLNLPSNNYEVYYMTAVILRNLPSPNDIVESGPSPFAVASCLAGTAALPNTGTTYTVQGDFVWDKKTSATTLEFLDGNGQQQDEKLQGIQFLVTYAGGDATFGTSDDLTVISTTNSSGHYSFTVTGGYKYRIKVLLPIYLGRINETTFLDLNAARFKVNGTYATYPPSNSIYEFTLSAPMTIDLGMRDN